ncbi:ribosomal protein L19E [Rhodovulum iodosum]|uniref:Ribosomal protein L19E n=1 Tax=Rhodovulum iodosum TaxID=68291 RepID=A0ABV3XQQ8_9RHOB|nr:glycosyltransferase [Rhodovulum robiginosum]RSK32914.1 glycosyltransferase [Rhodovulum robiginosum]
MNTQDQIDTIRESGRVDQEWYRETYPDVASLGFDPVEHYVKYGARMGRDPNPSFDTAFYLEVYSDVAESGYNPLLHYILFGAAEGRRPKATPQLKAVYRLTSHMWGGRGKDAAESLRQIADGPEVEPDIRFEAAYHLATWYAFQDEPDRARKVLEDIALYAPDLADRKELQMRLGFLHLQRGDADAARRCLESCDCPPDDPDMLLARASAEEDDDARLALINAVLANRGFAPIALRDPDRPLALSNLACPAAQAVRANTGLVSVIMPAFNAEATIETALRSLLDQTYPSLEIIVVDDCSTDGTFDVVQSLTREDPRIVPLRQPRNQGAYPARNAGLERATGRFVTTHDADDWSHPQKIATQVAALASDVATTGVVTHWARVRPDMRFTTNWRLSDAVIHWSHSSFLFRRDIVREVGRWDNLRVGADTEFIWRIQSRYGKSAVRRLVREAPLAFALDGESSLTRTKLTHVSTVYNGLRHYYREICRYWHQRPDGLTPENTARRMAMIPREMFDRDAAPAQCDLHLIGDLSRSEVVARMAEIAAAARGTVGVTHRVQLDSAQRKSGVALEFHPAFFELLQTDGVQIIVPGSGAQVDACLLVTVEYGDVRVAPADAALD